MINIVIKSKDDKSENGIVVVESAEHLPFNVDEGTFGFIKSTTTGDGKPVYFNHNNWYDFCCDTTDPVINRTFNKLVFVLSNSFEEDKLFVKVSSDNYMNIFTNELLSDTDTSYTFVHNFFETEDDNKLALYFTKNAGDKTSQLEKYKDVFNLTDDIYYIIDNTNVDDGGVGIKSNMRLNDTEPTLIVLNGQYENDNNKNDGIIYYAPDLMDGKNAAQNLKTFIDSNKVDQEMSEWQLEHEVSTGEHNIPKTNADMQVSLNNFQIETTGSLITVDSFYTVTSDKLQINKPIISTKPLQITLKAESNDYYKEFSPQTEYKIYTVHENDVYSKTMQELQDILTTTVKVNDVFRYNDNGPFIYYDGTQFTEIYSGAKVDITKVKVVTKWSLVFPNISDTIAEYTVSPSIIHQLAETVDITIADQNVSAIITGYEIQTTITDNVDASVNAINTELSIVGTNTLSFDTVSQDDDVIYTLSLIPNFEVQFSENDKDKLELIINNWNQNEDNADLLTKFNFDGFTNLNYMFKYPSANTNLPDFPWEKTGSWQFPNINELHDTFLGYTPLIFYPEKDEVLRNLMVTTITNWQTPLTQTIAEDMLEIYARIGGIDEITGAPLRGISYAWASVLSQSSIQNNYDFSIITPPTVYDKVVGILLKDVYPLNSFNFVEESVKEMNVNNETSLAGLFGVTNVWIHNKMFDAITKLANYNGIDTSVVRTAFINKLKVFNEDLSSWNVSNVTDFYRTFYKLPAYNQPWNWAYDPLNYSANYREMFLGAESMMHDIEFTDLVGSFPDQTDRSISTQKFSNVMTGTQAKLKVTNFETLLHGFGTSSIREYEHNNATIRYYVALDISKDLTTEDVNKNKIVNHRQDIGAPNGWKTQHVTIIDSLFNNTTFNKDINNWNVSSVTTMQYAFQYNAKFNKPLHLWDTSNVIRVKGMFWSALAFAQNLGSWNTSRITHMNDMFRNGLKNQSKNSDYDLYKWDLSSLLFADMSFSHGAFNGRLQSLADRWVSDKEYAKDDVVIHFEDDQKRLYRSRLNENTVDPSGATDNNWELLVYDASKTYSFFDFVWHNKKLYRFVTEVPTWFSEKVYYPNNLVYYQGKYYKNIQRKEGTVPQGSPFWEEVSIELIDGEDNLFWKEVSPDDAVMGWDRTWNRTFVKDTIIQYESEFYRASVEKLRRDDDIKNHTSWIKLNKWNTSETYSEGNFVYLNNNVYKASQTTTNPITNIDDWVNINFFEWNNVPRPSAASLFYKTQSINQPLEKLNMEGLTDFSNTFNDATKYNFPVNWNTTHAILFSKMFQNANSMNSKVKLDTSKATYMGEMFRNASKFNAEIQFNDVSNVQNMSKMFWGASSFNKPLNFNDGETEVNTHSLTNLSGMFFDAESFNQPVPFDVSRVTDFSYMFSGASSFDQDLSEWTKNSTNEFRTLTLPPTSSSNQRIFVDDIYRDDNQKRRYIIIQRDEVDNDNVKFTTTLYEDESVRKKYTINTLPKIDCHDLDTLHVDFSYDFGMTFVPVFIHYGKRIDIMVITDYPSWEEGVTYASGSIVMYNNKYYKSTRKVVVVNNQQNPETSLNWRSYYFYPTFVDDETPYSGNTYVHHAGYYYLSSKETSTIPGTIDSDWVIEHHVGDSVQENILSKFYTPENNMLRDEKLTYVTHGSQQSGNNKTYVFYSSQYVYSFKTSKVPSSNVFKDKLEIDYHNNPYRSSYGTYRGLIIGPDQNVSNINVYYTNVTRDREVQEDLMQQNIVTADRLGNNFLSVLYKRYRLPEVPLANSSRGDLTGMVGSIVRVSGDNQWTYYRVRPDGSLEEASYSFQELHDDLYTENTRVVAQNSEGYMRLYKTNSALSLKPSNESGLWEEVTNTTNNATTWSKDDFSYPQNTIVKLDSNYYQTSSKSLRSVKVDEDSGTNWDLLTVSQWTENTQYQKDTLVEHLNSLYKSHYHNNGSKPGTIGGNSTLINNLFSQTNSEKRVFPQNIYSGTKRFVTIERISQDVSTVKFITKIYENNGQVGEDYEVDLDVVDAYETTDLHVTYETSLNGSTKILIFVHYGSRVDIHVMDDNKTRHVDVLQVHKDKLGDEKIKYFGYSSQQTTYALYFRSKKYVYSMVHNSSLDYSNNSSSNINYYWSNHNNPEISSYFKGVVIGYREDFVINRYQTAYGHNRESTSSLDIHESQLLSAKSTGSNTILAVYRRFRPVLANFNIEQVERNFTIFSNSTSYLIGDVILYANRYFESTTNTNEGNIPFVKDHHNRINRIHAGWREITPINYINNTINSYVNGDRYAVDALVEHNKVTYKSYRSSVLETSQVENDMLTSATPGVWKKIKSSVSTYEVKNDSGRPHEGYEKYVFVKPSSGSSDVYMSFKNKNFSGLTDAVYNIGTPYSLNSSVNIDGNIYTSLFELNEDNITENEYVSTSTYNVDDKVRNGDGIFKSLVDNNTAVLSNTLAWQKTWEIGYDWVKINVWSSETFYSTSDKVVYNGEVFVSTIDQNEKNTPSDWQVENTTGWSSSKTYATDDYVIQNNHIYKYVSTATGGNTEDPDTSDSWEPVQIKEVNNNNETFATITHIFPASGQWVEFVLISSTDSPNNADPNTGKQDQRYITNKNEADLTNWKLFVDGLNDDPTILITNTRNMAHVHNSVILTSNNNEKMSVFKFTALHVYNGVNPDRYIYTSKKYSIWETSTWYGRDQIVYNSAQDNYYKANRNHPDFDTTEWTGANWTLIGGIPKDLPIVGGNKNHQGCLLKDIILESTLTDKNNVQITAVPSSLDFKIKFSTYNNVYLYGKNSNTIDKTDVFLIKNIDPEKTTEVEYNHFDFNYDDMSIVPNNNKLGDFDFYTLKTDLNINHVEALAFIQTYQWTMLNYEIWDSPIYTENQIVYVQEQNTYYKTKQDIKIDTYNPVENSKWTDIPISDNGGYNDVSVFATAIHNYVVNFFTEFVLISSDSPSYDTIYPYYDEASKTLVNDNGIQSQHHILNTRTNDLSNWKSFCNNMDESSQVRFQKEGNYVLLYSIDKNNNLAVVQFTSLYAVHGGNTKVRHLYVDKSKSQVLLYTSNIDGETVFNETDDSQVPTSLSNYTLSYHNGNVYAVRYENGKMNVFLFSKLVDNNVLKNKPGIIYNNFELKNNSVSISNVVDTQVVLNKDDLLDPDMYLLNDQNLYFVNMKSYNLYSAQTMKAMFNAAYNFSNPFTGLVFYVKLEQTFTEIKFEIVTDQGKHYLKYTLSGAADLFDYTTETNLYFSINNGTIKTKVRDQNNKIVNTPKGGISNFMTSSVTDMNSTFLNASKLFISLASWTVMNVTDDGNFNALSNENDTDYEPNGLNNTRITHPKFNRLIKSNRNELLEALYYRFRQPGSYNIDYGYLEDWILSSVITDLSDLTNIDLLARAAGKINENDTLNEEDTSIMMNNIKIFNDSLSKWNVQHIRTFQNMLKDCTSFNNKNGQKLSDHWSVHHGGANLNNMFDGCLVYTDDITPFFVNDSSFEYYNWKNVASNAPNVYFKPAKVENASVSLLDGKLRVSWENGEYFPAHDRLKFDVHITKKNTGTGNYDSIVSRIDHQPSNGETSIEFSNYDFSGELKVKIHARSFPKSSSNIYSQFSDDVVLDLIITTNNAGIIEVSQKKTIIKEFKDSSSTLNLKWTYDINEIKRTENNLTKSITKLESTEIEDMNSSQNVKIQNAFGLSINFENGNMLSYVTLNSQYINLVLATSVSDANKIIIEDVSSESSDLYKYDTAVYHTDENDKNVSFVLLRKNDFIHSSLTLYCVDHTNSNSIPKKVDIIIPTISNSTVDAVSNISISKNKLSFVVRYKDESDTEYTQCWVVEYHYENETLNIDYLEENNYYDNTIIGQLYHDGTQLVILNSDRDIISLHKENETETDITINPANVLTIHFKTEFELVIGISGSEPKFVSL
jgi:hypothetical protein